MVHTFARARFLRNSEAFAQLLRRVRFSIVLFECLDDRMQKGSLCLYRRGAHRRFLQRNGKTPQTAKLICLSVASASWIFPVHTEIPLAVEKPCARCCRSSGGQLHPRREHPTRSGGGPRPGTARATSSRTSCWPTFLETGTVARKPPARVLYPPRGRGLDGGSGPLIYLN